MASGNPTPNLQWYTAIGERKRLDTTRCPFASADRCPRYYQSLSLLGDAGATRIDPKVDAKLLRRWKRHDLWPKTREQETSIMGPVDEPHIYSRFCPEVSYDTFGIFASAMARYADEIDSGNAHEALGRQGAAADDWRWAWSQVTPLHYSDCPLFAPLLHESKETRVDKILSWAKNNRFISVLIVAGIVLAAVSGAVTQWFNVLSPFKGEHVVIIATKVSSGDMSYNGKIEGDALVQFAPNNSRQNIQRIVLDFPEDLASRSITVTPPFKRDVGSQLVRMNDVLQGQIPIEKLSEPYHGWMTHDSTPVALTVDYLTSGGDLRTEKSLYEMDFFYQAYQRCDSVDNCVNDHWGIGLSNFRYERLLGRFEDPKSTVNTVLAKKHFKFEETR
jgi:hypothetical protein